jgi:hypothetical protein
MMRFVFEPVLSHLPHRRPQDVFAFRLAAAKADALPGMVTIDLFLLLVLMVESAF